MNGSIPVHGKRRCTGMLFHNRAQGYYRKASVMQKSVNFKVINPKFVNLQVFCFLLVACIALHVLALLALPEHPILSSLLSICESLGWCFVLLIGVIWIGKGLKRLVCTTCAHVVTFVRTHVHFKRSKKETFISVEKLKKLRTRIQVFGLALYGTTPEKETARRNSYQLLGQAAPDLVLPRSNVSLQGEFDNGLVRFLNHAGFPHVENVRLKTSEFELVNVWINDLFDRLYQLQQDERKAHVALENDLTTADLLLQSLLRKYPTVESDSGYNRLTGALRVLKAMSKDIPCDQLHPYTQALLRDMNALCNTLRETAA
jgi:hypothetical protein